jgi:hypothetical protein
MFCARWVAANPFQKMEFAWGISRADFPLGFHPGAVSNCKAEAGGVSPEIRCIMTPAGQPLRGMGFAFGL